MKIEAMDAIRTLKNEQKEERSKEKALSILKELWPELQCPNLMQIFLIHGNKQAHHCIIHADTLKGAEFNTIDLYFGKQLERMNAEQAEKTRKNKELSEILLTAKSNTDLKDQDEFANHIKDMCFKCFGYVTRDVAHMVEIGGAEWTFNHVQKMTELFKMESDQREWEESVEMCKKRKQLTAGLTPIQRFRRGLR